jgi:DNA-binding MarR family transcriptional regulator
MKKRNKTRERTRTAVRTAAGEAAALGGLALAHAPGAGAHGDEGGSQHIEIRIWLRLLSCATLIENVLKSRLRRDFATSLARFDVLGQLDRCQHGLTMTELSRRLLVSNGAVTGLVEKLAADGLVLREEPARDKRTVIVQLTAEGRSQFRKMALRHEEWVVSLLGDLSHAARVELLHNLTLLKRRLDAVTGKSGQIEGGHRLLADPERG